MNTTVTSTEAMQEFGEQLGSALKGGEVIELIGDIGAGKTTLTKGIGKALQVDDDVQSPTFTLSRVYESPSGITLAHYDFYRLPDPGVLRMELAEMTTGKHNVTVIEWADVVADVLPSDRLQITIRATADDARILKLHADGPRSQALIEAIA